MTVDIVVTGTPSAPWGMLHDVPAQTWFVTEKGQLGYKGRGGSGVWICKGEGQQASLGEAWAISENAVIGPSWPVKDIRIEVKR